MYPLPPVTHAVFLLLLAPSPTADIMSPVTSTILLAAACCV
jgi:hypothetical protein